MRHRGQVLRTRGGDPSVKLVKLVVIVAASGCLVELVCGRHPIEKYLHDRGVSLAL